MKRNFFSPNVYQIFRAKPIQLKSDNKHSFHTAKFPLGDFLRSVPKKNDENLHMAYVDVSDVVEK